MSRVSNTAAILLVTAVSASLAFGGDSTISQQLGLLRDRLDAAERAALLQAIQQKGVSAKKGARAAEHEIPAHEGTRGSQIIEQPALPDPDIAAIRKSLGLRQTSPHEALGSPNAGESPTPADLAESDAVLLTPEIRSLAQQLGSACARRSRPLRRQRWLGPALAHTARAPRRRAAARSVESRCRRCSHGATTILPGRDSNVDFYHVWTEAWLGDKWVSFDGSFKMLEYEPGIELPVQPFDMDVFLSTQRRELASDLYVDSVRAYLNRTFPRLGMSDVLYGGRLAATDDTIGAPPYRVIQAMDRPQAFVNPPIRTSWTRNRDGFQIQFSDGLLPLLRFKKARSSPKLKFLRGKRRS